MVYVGLMAFVTLTPVGWVINRVTVRLYVFFAYDVPVAPGALPEDYGRLLNVLFYVPAGFLLATTRLRWWGATVACVAASALCELVQPVFGRDSTVDDVVLNGLGGFLGALLALVITWRRARP